jgi:hypothetical protein
MKTIDRTLDYLLLNANVSFQTRLEISRLSKYININIKFLKLNYLLYSCKEHKLVSYRLYVASYRHHQNIIFHVPEKEYKILYTVKENYQQDNKMRLVLII